MKEIPHGEWRFWYAQHKGTLLAAALFAVMFVIYVSNHPAGFTPNVVQTASNKAALLAFVAMAQCFVVITAGIDLSVGMILILCNCLASWLVVGTPFETALGVVAVLLTGLACGVRNGLVIIVGRLQPIVTRIPSGGAPGGWMNRVSVLAPFCDRTVPKKGSSAR